MCCKYYYFSYLYVMENRNNNIIKDYLNNIQIHIIKDTYKVSYETIKKLCLLENIWNPDRNKLTRRLYNHEPVLVKQNPFLDLSNSNVQYYLGLLATDGNVYKNCISLSLKEEDLDSIIKYAIFCGCNKDNVKYTKDNRYENYYMCNFRFNNCKIADYLKNLGIVENKSLILNLNTDLTWNMLRGIIDGDGCFYYHKSKKGKNIYKITVSSSSICFINQIKDFLNLNNIKSNINKVFKNRKNINYNITISNHLDCLKVIDYLYTDTNTFMSRKYFNAQYIRNNILKTHPKLREPVSGILKQASN